MLIQTTSAKGNFKLSEKGRVLCELNYTSWFRGKAKSRCKGHTLEIKPRSFWGHSFNVFKDNIEVGDISFSIKGRVMINLQEKEGKMRHFVMRLKGFLKPRFEVYDAKDDSICTLQAVNNWKKMNYDYNVTFNRESEELANPEEFLLLCGYGANLYWTHISAV